VRGRVADGRARANRMLIAARLPVKGGESPRNPHILQEEPCISSQGIGFAQWYLLDPSEWAGGSKPRAGA
jgi:hypothetical protein